MGTEVQKCRISVCSLREAAPLVWGMDTSPRSPEGSDDQEPDSMLSCTVGNCPERCCSLSFSYCPNLYGAPTVCQMLHSWSTYCVPDAAQRPRPQRGRNRAPFFFELQVYDIL